MTAGSCARECDEFGIDRSRLTARAAPTPFSDCINSLESGRRTHLYFPGVADEMTPDDFDFAGVYARILHLGLPGAHAKMDAPWGEDATGWVTVAEARARSRADSQPRNGVDDARRTARGSAAPARRTSTS